MLIVGIICGVMIGAIAGELSSMAERPRTNR